MDLSMTTNKELIDELIERGCVITNKSVIESYKNAPIEKVHVVLVITE